MIEVGKRIRLLGERRLRNREVRDWEGLFLSLYGFKCIKDYGRSSESGLLVGG